MIKNIDQWNWIKETLSKMEPTEMGLGVPWGDGETLLDMWSWGDFSDCGFAGCAIGHLVVLNPEQTLLDGDEDGYDFDQLCFLTVAEYFGISRDDSVYAFGHQTGDNTDPSRVVERMEEVEKSMKGRTK